MTQLFANNATSTLAADITSGALSLTVATGHGARFPSPTGGDYFLVTLSQSGTETSWEIVKVTARTGDVFTVVRAQEGTSAAIWATGDTVENRETAGTLASFAQAGIQFATLTLTTAQLLALDTTPVEWLPAPSGRNYIWPLAVWGHYRAGATPFLSADAYVYLGWGTGVADYFTYLTADGFMTEATDQYQAAGLLVVPPSPSNPVQWPLSVIEATPITAWTDVTVTAGDGALSIRMMYVVVDGAP